MDDSPPLCPLDAYIEGNFRFPSGSASTRIADLLEVMESLERVGRAPGMPNVLSLFGGARVVYPKKN